MSKKSTLEPSYDGLKKICQNSLPVTLFKQLPRAKIWPKFKNFCAHQIANNQMIVLSLKIPKKFILDPSYGRLKKSSPEIGY